MHNTDITYFDSFGLEHIQKEAKAFIDSSLSVTTNIFRIKAYYSITCEYFVLDLLILYLQENLN